MIDLNVKFQEQYKRLDSLCKDIFSSKDGVTQYIYEMENTPWDSRRFISNWDTIYKNLKHLRWVRNQLAHEIGTFEDDLCTANDIEWLSDFYTSILKTTDPLAQARKAKQAEYNNLQQNRCKTIQNNDYEYIDKEKQKTSFWSKIKEKLKKWFL